jgi:hypothetical protein
MRTRAGWLGSVGFLAVLVCSQVSSAFYLDSERRFDVRVRAYSQLGIMTEDSETKGCPTAIQVAKAKAIADPAARKAKLALLNSTCPPEYDAGALGQHRNFYNPEFDANLTDWMHWAYADEFKFRFAWWGFYDGLYDYLDPVWNQHRRDSRTRYSESSDVAKESFTFSDQGKNPRHYYGSRNRINELYFDYTHGPFFLRVGRQAISWGESDTVALLDVQNPFDIIINPFFSDPDESRIPLWTVRSTLKLTESLGPLSSVFADVYLVPGILDTTIALSPLEGGVSPFSPDVPDPQLNVTAQGAVASFVQTVLVDHTPETKWSNSRWGLRLAGVLWRDYTVQSWFFRTFNEQPAPIIANASAFGLFSKGQTTLVDNMGGQVPSCPNGFYQGRPCHKAAPAVTILEHRLESVVGLAATWFSPPVNGILKWEIEYFNGELATIPTQNLNPRVQLPSAVRKGEPPNTVPTADYLRWVVGYDRNFFVHWLNPTNSFILVASYNSQFNLSEKGGKDFRSGQAKPGHPQTRMGPIPGNALCKGKQAFSNPFCIHVDPHDYEDIYQYEGFLTTTVRTDYMHGRLEPSITLINDVSGYWAWAVGATYRINDNLIAGLNYVGIEAPWRKSGLATYRAHDMVQLRITAQLN